MDHGLVCFNDTDNVAPTYQHPASDGQTRCSTIDATFGSPDLPIAGWRVMTDCPYGGDHYPLLFTLRGGSTTSDERGPPHDLCDLVHSKTDWASFTTYLDHQKAYYYAREALSPSGCPDTLESRIATLLQGAARTSTPIRDNRPCRSTINTWWDHELRSSRSKLARTKRQHGSSSDIYKKERREYRDMIANKKMAGFAAFASSIESRPDFLSKITRDRPPPPTTITGFPTVEGTVTALADRYLGDPIPPHFLDTVRSPPNSGWDSQAGEGYVDFPLGIVKEELSKRGKDTSPGSCGIRWEHLLHTPDWLLSEVCRLFQWCFDVSATPLHWRHSTVRYIPKASGYGTAKGIRPITLSCTLCKLQEAVIARRLSPYTEAIIRCDEHFAYLPRRSATLMVDKMIHYAQQGLSGKLVKKKPPWAIVGLDLSNAFGTVPHCKLLQGLQSIGIPTKEIEWIRSWLGPRLNSNRYLGIDTTRMAKEGIGLAQGSVLSPLLFVYFMHYVISAIKDDLPDGPFPYRWFVYADDCHLVFKFKPRSSQEDRDSHIHNFLDRLSTLLGLYNLSLSTEKTEILTSYVSQAYPAKHIGILGITITRRLSFHLHLKARLSKCHGITLKAWRYARSSFGVSPDSILLLAKSVWLPTLCYGLEVWGTTLAINKSTLLIDSAYRKILKLAYRLPPSAPNSFVDLLCDSPSLSYTLIDKLLVKSMHCMEHPPAPSSLPNHFSWCPSLSDKWLRILHDRLPDYGITDWYAPGPPIPIDVANRIIIEDTRQAAITRWRSLSGIGIDAYTDGSLVKDGLKATVGAGFVVVRGRTGGSAARRQLPSPTLCT
ncbi:conserved hypothetical protein [Perkinsus marinus ATCC 50983]|uniref:Reverse transcriptase domain-containing protein n=1 Tax=Perkinsus marinus (strain ATCC 50983 / TXsc) TaxID=423536 RepID=C5KLH7_PERM5|nr:conserved hypothetical protein [Perkinsus marinus ATCC 50983]EER14672.1 conserved hypothetical protein [Perkinsus marinus ATCC 50983]|eukprot:XP_002782876.1 conserved hypothetical protein [Perkinsus marinus ATCC 50983]